MDLQDLIRKNDELIAAGKKPMFAKSNDEARLMIEKIGDEPKTGEQILEPIWQ